MKSTVLPKMAKCVVGCIVGRVINFKGIFWSVSTHNPVVRGVNDKKKNNSI